MEDESNNINTVKTELNKIKKKNQKLEEGYIKLNSDLKNLKSDRQQMENFLRTIFPKESSEKLFNKEYGLYESDELNKHWMISETEKENEFQKILSVYKIENSDLLSKITHLEDEIKLKNNEINLKRQTLEENQNQLDFYINNFKNKEKKNLELENEKIYLMKIIDEKANEIDRLQQMELEIAEFKAQQLLMNNNFDDDDEYDEGFVSKDMGKINHDEEIFKETKNKEEDKKKNKMFGINKEELKIGK